MKIRENRMYVVWICMAGFLAGILYANVLAADEIAGIGIFQEYFLGRFSGVEILSADYIWYIARIRAVPLFLLAARRLGWTFVIYSLFGVGVYAGFSLLFHTVLPIDFSAGSPIVGEDMLLAALFGGFLSGVGSGMVIRFGGAIDGAEVLAVLYAKRLGLSVGNFMMIYNVILYSIAALVFRSWIIPLYSVVAYAVGNKTIDFVVDGFDRGNSVFIVTGKKSDLAAQLGAMLGRGVTLLDSYGGYSGEEKTLIYCVVNRFEIGMVKRLVIEHEPDAFMAVGDVSETVGGAGTRFSLGRMRRERKARRRGR